MTSTFTPAIHLEEPASGDYVDAWDVPANSNYTQIDAAIGATTTITLSSGTVNLTQAQANCALLAVNGAPTADVSIFYPAGGGRKAFMNNCVMSGHTIFIKGNGGLDTHGIWSLQAFGLPVPFLVTPTRVWWDYATPPGTIVAFPPPVIPPGWIACNGGSLNTTTFDLLFGVCQYTYGGSGVNFRIPNIPGSIIKW